MGTLLNRRSAAKALGFAALGAAPAAAGVTAVAASQ